jgi:hypothetical protein
VDQILVDLLSGTDEQAAVSEALLEAERGYQKALEGAEAQMVKSRAMISGPAQLAGTKTA